MTVYMPKESNFYGYCRTFDYTPKTTIFVELYQVIAREENPVPMLQRLIHSYEKNISSYQKFTELVIVVNLMSWDLHTRDENAARFLADEYYRLSDKFYKIFKDKEARDYFWEMTD